MAQLNRTDDSPKREAILDAALELFVERGFYGTAVPLVAERAKVGAGTLYRYFESKEALVNALFQRWKTELARALMGAGHPPAPARELFHRLWTAMGRFAVDHPKALAFLELHHHDAYLDARSKEVEQGLLLPLKAMVEHWQSQQILKPVAPEILMTIVWGTFVGLLRACWLGHLRLEPAIFGQFEECLWEAIRR